MNKTKIEWTEYSWNPVSGCTPISEGCQNCYAKRMSKRLAGRCGYPADDPFRVTLHLERLDEPLKWKKPRRVFVCSMGDLFHDDVPESWIFAAYTTIEKCPQHTFLLLTKRIHRAAEVFNKFTGRSWPLPNVWLGVTAENQQRADERIPILLQIPAAVRFVSIEPMLGPVDFTNYLPYTYEMPDEWGNPTGDYYTQPGVDWVICGGETGPGARPMHPDWVRSLRDQCQAAGVPFFFKQHGEWLHETQGIDFHEGHKYYVWPDESMSFRVGKKAAGRILDGQIWDEMPEINRIEGLKQIKIF
jgi:protein gp37